MAEIELNSQTPFVLTLNGTTNSAGEVIADLRNTMAQVVYLPDVLAASADVQKVVAPTTGDILSAMLVLNAATATGACTATLDIGGVAVTGGVASVTGASGTVGTATPTAANSVAAGVSVVGVTISGANTQAGDGTLTIIYQVT